MRVLIACLDPGVRDRFVETLRRAGFSVIAAPPDEAATLELARRRRPDIILLDEEFPGLGDVSGLQKLAAETPGSRVVTITGRYDETRGLRTVLAGAAGYLERQISPGALRRVAHALMRGEAAIPRPMTMPILDLARGEVGMRPVRSALTPREWEVLDLLTTGASTQQISNELVVSLETVQSHIKHILRKFGVHSRAEAVARAQELRHHSPKSSPK